MKTDPKNWPLIPKKPGGNEEKMKTKRKMGVGKEKWIVEGVKEKIKIGGNAK